MESQVTWEDPKEVEERMKLLEQMKSMDTSPTPLDTSMMEMETMSSIDIDNITANMMESLE